MRAYTVTASAVALGVSRKWLDNVLSHHRVSGVLQNRQGITRRVTPGALLVLEIAARLGRAFAVPLAPALEIAAHLIQAKGGGAGLPGDSSVVMIADIEAITTDLNTRLERAVEMSPIPRRGRPRRK